MKNTLNPTRLMKMFLAIPLAAIMIGGAGCEESEVSDPTSRQPVSEQQNALHTPEEVYEKADVAPKPIDGMEGLAAYIQNNLTYPEEAKAAGTEGKVFVQFVVKTDGSISDVEVKKGIGNGCDEEAARVVSSLPAWEPGTRNGEKVNVRLILPIAFKLDS